METLLNILSDSLFAAVAAIGFGVISDISCRSYSYIALIAGMGHALRYILMTCCGVDIVSASFIASVSIGFVSLMFAIRIRRPLTCLYIPALLPMIPGMYAYKTVFSLILFVQSPRTSADHFQYLMAFMSNATITCMVIVVLAVGATIPYFIFKRRALSMTRGRTLDKTITSGKR